MTQPHQGRPRNAKTTNLLLARGLDQILKGGFEAVNFESLAVVSRTTRTTIYRRWPSKVDLVRDILELVFPPSPVPNSGSSVENVVEHFMQDSRYPLAVKTPEHIKNLWSTIINPEVLPLYHEEVAQHRRKNLDQILALAVQKNDLPEDLDQDLFSDAVSGFLLYRNVMIARPATEGELRSQVTSLFARPPVLAT